MLIVLHANWFAWGPSKSMVNFFLYQYAYNWFANEICYIIIGCSGSVNWFPRVALLKFLSNAMLIAASTSPNLYRIAIALLYVFLCCLACDPRRWNFYLIWKWRPIPVLWLCKLPYSHFSPYPINIVKSICGWIILLSLHFWQTRQLGYLIPFVRTLSQLFNQYNNCLLCQIYISQFGVWIISCLVYI